MAVQALSGITGLMWDAKAITLASSTRNGLMISAGAIRRSLTVHCKDAEMFWRTFNNQALGAMDNIQHSLFGVNLSSEALFNEYVSAAMAEVCSRLDS